MDSTKALAVAIAVSSLLVTGSVSAKFLSVDPVKAEPKQGGNFNRYYYANNNPYKYFDPDGRATVVVVNDNKPLLGTHAGWVILRGDTATIYDPAGGFRPQTRGTGGLMEVPRSEFRDYVRSQFVDGTDVKLFVFPTTEAQEAQLFANAETQGDPRGFSCTISVTSTLQGISLFEGLETTWLPSNLRSQLENNSNQVPQPPSPDPNRKPEPEKPDPDVDSSR